MSEGLIKTFELLGATGNEAAVDVLLAALDSPTSELRSNDLRRAAIEALLRRRSTRGHRALVDRWHQFDETEQALVDAQQGRLAQALRDALVSSEPQTVANACRAIARLHEYDLLPVLLAVVEDPQQRHSQAAALTVLELADLLHAELTSPRDYRNRRDPQLVRRNLTVSLEQSVTRFNRHERPEVIEAFLLLAARDNCTLQQILLDPFHGSYRGLVDQLLQSERTGVWRVLVSFLDDPNAPSSALQTLARRHDPPFVRYLLKRMTGEPSNTLLHNLKRFDGFAWSQPQHGLLETLDDAAQHAAIRLIVGSNIKRPDAFRIVQQMARHGTPGGRRAAYETLEHFPGAQANLLILEALDDPDPLVQAIGVRQLRQRGVPGILPRLISMTDTPHDVVREALREALAEFQFKRFLASYDMLEPAVRTTTAPLVRKLDPDYRRQLLEEMDSSARTRRLRSIEIAEAMQAVDAVDSRLIELLGDSDHLVRSEAARVLAASDSLAARRALEQLLLDRSVLVQDTAKASLQEIADRARMRSAERAAAEVRP